ncbi:MAG: MEDS domain-containing protein [Limisphaerales bacterium]
MNSSERQARTENFWTEISTHDHILHLYDDDADFLRALEPFIRDGLQNNESVVVIATSAHLKSAKEWLSGPGMACSAAGRYMPFDAEAVLARFTMNHWPDARLFAKVITGILAQAAEGGRSVRAFGEMVALLWEKGQFDATLRLEHLWNNLKKVYSFPLLCAYPKSCFAKNNANSLESLCAAHSKMVVPSRLTHNFRPRQ